MDRSEITTLLSSAGLLPQHRFGQNFMVDGATLLAIADAGDVRDGDVILEVGPGVGNLTRVLSKRAGKGRVLAVDIDGRLLAAAQRHHAELANVSWMVADVLAGKHAVEPAVLAKLRELKAAAPAGEVKLVSNLPYNAASPLIAELLVEMWREARESGPGKGLMFSRMAFTVQYEVGLRMTALPKGEAKRDYGPLGVLIQSLASAEIVRKIPPGVFWPPPKIHSALVVVVPRGERFAGMRDAVAFQKFLAGIFSHRRQTLANALKHYYQDGWTAGLKRKVTEEGFDLTQRPENFPPDALLRLEHLIHTSIAAA